MNDAFTGSINLTHPAESGKPEQKLATIHVLVLWEDKEWCAIALELGIRSYGPTIAGAYRTLTNAVEAQVTFTMEQGGWDEMFETQAEQRYIDLFFQTSALEARRIFAELEGPRTTRPRFPHVKQLEENAVHLANLDDLRGVRPRYEATT